MAKLKISDQMKISKQELLLDPTKKIVKDCDGSTVDALTFNDLMYRQEDDTYIPATALLAGLKPSISKVRVQVEQNLKKAYISWEGVAEVTFIPPTDPNAVTVTRDDHSLQVDVVAGLNTIQIKGKEDKFYTVLGHYVYSEAEIDVMSQAAGFKSPEEVLVIQTALAECNTEKATMISAKEALEALQSSLSSTKGYVNILSLDVASKKIKWRLDRLATDVQKATKIGYVYQKPDNTEYTETMDVIKKADGTVDTDHEYEANLGAWDNNGSLDTPIDIIVKDGNKYLDRVNIHLTIVEKASEGVAVPYTAKTGISGRYAEYTGVGVKGFLVYPKYGEAGAGVFLKNENALSSVIRLDMYDYGHVVLYDTETKTSESKILGHIDLPENLPYVFSAVQIERNELLVYVKGFIPKGKQLKVKIERMNLVYDEVDKYVGTFLMEEDETGVYKCNVSSDELLEIRRYRLRPEIRDTDDTSLRYGNQVMITVGKY